MPQPFVIVVTGRPGAGKTTLAHALAQHIHCPALCRDEFKEGYVHTLEGAHASLGNDLNRRLYDIFFATVDFVVSKGISVIIEAAFQHATWAPRLTHLAEVARVSILVCTVNPRLAQARAVERALTDATRARFHGESVAVAAIAYDPPQLDLPTLSVDTTAGYNPTLEQIISFVSAR